MKASSTEAVSEIRAPSQLAPDEPPCSPERSDVGFRSRKAGGRLTFDAEYLRKLAEGDQRVEEEFFAYFRPLLEIKIRRHLGAWADDVQDLRQETFKRVLATLRGGPGVRHPERFGAFVAGVCQNVIRERRNDRPPPAAAAWATGSLWSSGPDSELVRAEVVALVRRVLDALPRQDRALLRAVFLEERSRAEICEQFGVQQGYLRVLLHRAKKRFRARHRDVSRDAASIPR